MPACFDSVSRPSPLLFYNRYKNTRSENANKLTNHSGYYVHLSSLGYIDLCLLKYTTGDQQLSSTVLMPRIKVNKQSPQRSSWLIIEQEITNVP